MRNIISSAIITNRLHLKFKEFYTQNDLVIWEFIFHDTMTATMSRINMFSGKVMSITAGSLALIMIGHPSGLPQKIAGGARVRDNSPSSHFVANTDSYGGNSGSPIFNEATHEVEGILVRGVTDYVAEGGCNVSNQCDDDGCGGEDGTRATHFADLVPPPGGPVVYEV